jgi:hypothetical protein
VMLGRRRPLFDKPPGPGCPSPCPSSASARVAGGPAALPCVRDAIRVSAFLDDPRFVQEILRHLRAWHDPTARGSPPGASGPHTHEPCDDVDPMPDYLLVDIPASPCQYRTMLGETQKPILPHPRSAQYERESKKQFSMCSLRALTCLQVRDLPRQRMVGPSSDSRLTNPRKESEAKGPQGQRPARVSRSGPSWTESVRLADQAVVAFAGAGMINRAEPRACGHSRGRLRKDAG